MNTLTPFFYKLRQNVAAIFSPRNLLWQALAIVLTYVFVASGFDWFYFVHTRSPLIFEIFIPAAILGFLVPILTPLVLFVLGLLRGNAHARNAAYALGQSAGLAWAISSLYKAVTGRVHPELFGNASRTLADTSRIFHFGFLQGGIFWGWPSSHTMVAFAAATTTIFLSSNFGVRLVALILAAYVGVGVSLTIHWFSDFVAGAILGTLVGAVVGRAFARRN